MFEPRPDAELFPALNVRTALSGVIALKVDQVKIQPLFQVLDAALLWGPVWWFLGRH
jgi:hypothetical protein